MAATLHVLRPQTPPLAGFLRIGYTGHRSREDMIRLRDALADLDSMSSVHTRSRTPIFRGGASGLSAVLGQ